MVTMQLGYQFSFRAWLSFGAGTCSPVCQRSQAGLSAAKLWGRAERLPKKIKPFHSSLQIRLPDFSPLINGRTIYFLEEKNAKAW